MGTTVELDPEAYAALKTKAAQEGLPLNHVASKLILCSIESSEQNLAVFKSGKGKYSSQDVEESLTHE